MYHEGMWELKCKPKEGMNAGKKVVLKPTAG